MRLRNAVAKLLDLLEAVAGPPKWTWQCQGRKTSSNGAVCPPRESWGQCAQLRVAPRDEDIKNPFFWLGSASKRFTFLLLGVCRRACPTLYMSALSSALL